MDLILHLFRFRGGPLKRLRLVPHAPEEVYLLWAITFTVQYLGDWGLRESSDASNGYEKRRRRFASEVLTSAILQSCAGGLMAWDEWEIGTSMASGRVTLDGLLSWVRTSGFGQPYSAARWAMKEGEGRYNGWEENIRRFVAEMPPHLVHDIKLNVERLEWLAVMLAIGERMGETDRVWTVNEGRDDVESEVSEQGQQVDDLNEAEIVEKGDLAIENLEIQLGFSRGSISGNEDPVSCLRDLSLIPLPKQDVLRIARGNRLVCTSGEFVDIWLALVGGDDVGYLLEKHGDWECRALGRSVCNPDVEMVESTVSSGVTETDLERESLAYVHAELTRTSLKMQMTQRAPAMDHLDQTLTFMGYDMEILRSHLMKWSKRRGKMNEASVWTPRIPYDPACNSMATRGVSIGNLSAKLSSSLKTSEAPVDLLGMRNFQVRVIWEIRRLLQDKTTEGEMGPGSTPTMLLCLLAFPALSVSAATRVYEENVSKDSHMSNKSILPTTKTIEGGNGRGGVYCFTIRPRCGPQHLFVGVRLHVGRNVRVRVYLERGLREEDDLFEWEWWRDSFLGRLDGRREWKERHGFGEEGVVRWTDGEIGGGVTGVDMRDWGTGDRVSIWIGWLPFRVRMVREELISDGFLVPRDKTTRKSGYENVSRDVLKYGCLALEQILQVKGRSQAGVVGYAQQVLNTRRDQGMFLLQVAAKKHGHISAVRQMAEIFLTDAAGCPLSTLIEVLEIAGRTSLETGDEESISTIDNIYTRLAYSQYEDDPLLHKAFLVWTQQLLKASVPFDMNLWESRVRRGFLRTNNMSKLTTLARMTRTEGVLKVGLLERAGEEEADALYDLACLYQEGTGEWMRKDLDKTRELLERSVREHDHVESMVKLGRVLESQGSHESALDLYETAVERGGGGEALFRLGNLVRNGGGGREADMGRAVELYTRAMVEHEHCGAMTNLATMFFEGVGVGRDVNRAKRLLEEAVQRGGGAVTKFNLAVVLRGSKEQKRVLELLEEVAGEGDRRAMVMLGDILRERDGILAEKWYERGGGEEGTVKWAECVLAREAGSLDGVRAKLELVARGSSAWAGRARLMLAREAVKQVQNRRVAVHIP